MIDTEMLSMFLEEAGENLAQAENSLLRLQEDKQDQEAVAELFRALHTLKGLGTMMGLDSLAELAHEAENMVSLFRDEGVKVSRPGIDLLLEVVDVLTSMTETVENAKKCPDVPPDLLQSLKDFCSSPSSFINDLSDDSENSDQSRASSNTQDFKPKNLDVFFFVLDEELPDLEEAVQKYLQGDGEFKNVLAKLKTIMSIAGTTEDETLISLLKQMDEIDPDSSETPQKLENLFSSFKDYCFQLKNNEEHPTPQEHPPLLRHPEQSEGSSGNEDSRANRYGSCRTEWTWT